MALQAVGHPDYTAAVDEDWQRAAALGVTAVPTGIYQQRTLVGFQPYANYCSLISGAE
jgi:predicted DsbA family dithiol-disulfide isomerase